MSLYGKTAKCDDTGYDSATAIINLDHGQPVQKSVKRAPVRWTETFIESDEDIAAGRVVPIDDAWRNWTK